jgi:hypothetical protein
VTVGSFTSTGIDDNATSTAITIDSSQNVGIGASDPSDAGLVVDAKGEANTSASARFKSNVDTYLRIARFGTGSDSTITLGNNYNRNGGSFSADNSAYPTHNIAFNTDGSIRFGNGAAGSTAPTERMRIDASGRVGIGEAFPTTAKVVIKHNAPQALEVQSTGANTGIRYVGTAGSWQVGTSSTGSFTAYDITNNKTPFRVDANAPTNTIRALSSGRVGIGTDDPTSTLDVSGRFTISGGSALANSVHPYMRREGGNLRIAGRSDGGSGGNIMICTGASEDVRVTVDPSGNTTFSGTVNVTGQGNSSQWNTAYADTSTATSAFTANKIAKRDSTGSCKFRDLWIDRNDTTGALYFGNSGSRYLYYTGSNYQFANAPILASTGTSTFGGISSTGAIVSTKGADAIQIYNGSTQVGQIEATDTTWLRINQDVAKNIYTPRYIRADAGFFVDGTAKGINGDGNYIGGTVTCTAISNFGSFTGRTNTSTVFNSSNDTGSMSVRGDVTHPAVISFHRVGAYAVNFGLDGSNMKLGGWSAGGTKFLWNTSNGDFHADGNVIAYSTTVSDERLKDDVQLITSALDTVDSLRGVTYTWNAGSRKGKRDYGVIAQEVEQVIPEIVHETTMPLINGDEETIYKTVDYEKLCAVLINAVSELRAEVEALKNGSSD